MSIADKVRAAADYDAWKQVQVQAGVTDYSVDDYERHLRTTLAGDRLDQVHELASDWLATPTASRENLTKALADIARLSDLSEENQ